MSRAKILQGLNTYSPGPAIEHPVPVAQPPDILADRFVANLEASRAEVLRCTEQHLAEHLNRILEDKQIRRLCIGADPALQTLVDAIREDIDLTTYTEPVEEFCQALFEQIDAGFTGCDAALAETGTLVLYSRPDQPRLLSLVPPVHIALVRRDQLVTNMAEWLAEVDINRVPTNMVLISGPSKSADIEQVLAYGVHGPKQLVVLLVE